VAKSITIDEIHLTVRVPNDLPDDESAAIHTALAGAEFMNRLRRAIRAALRAFPELAVVRVSLTR
jgi:hypothetical protein